MGTEAQQMTWPRPLRVAQLNCNQFESLPVWVLKEQETRVSSISYRKLPKSAALRRGADRENS